MYDIFHYHSRPIFFKWQPDYSFNFFDLPFLKSQNKKIIFTLRGSETRLENKFKLQEFSYSIAKANDLVRLKLFKYIRKYADHITALDPELCSYFGKTIIIPRSIEKIITERNTKNNKKKTFLHCPSKRERKGTDTIISAFKELRNEGYDFDFKNLLNLTHSELMSEIMKTDVLIDQLIIGWYGIVAIEAMSRGTPVISYIRKDFEDYVKNNNIPIINADPKNIKYVIKKILDDEINLTEYKKKSLNFVKSFHLSKNVFEQYKKLYLRKNKQVYISGEDKLMIKKFFKKNSNIRKLRISFTDILIYESKLKLRFFYMKIKNYFYSKKIVRKIYNKTKFFYNKIK
jgi:glycosyltransferase involved in cell wall biosynthesis